MDEKTPEPTKLQTDFIFEKMQNEIDRLTMYRDYKDKAIKRLRKKQKNQAKEINRQTAEIDKLKVELTKMELRIASYTAPLEHNATLVENARLRTELAILKEFVRHVIKVHCWGIEEIDGGDTQDKALELGLIEAHIATEEDVDPEFDEVGDTIYRFSDILKGATDGVQDESI